MATNIKITALTDIGTNISASTLAPVVDMTGIPITAKANLQIIGNLILSGAGGSNFAPAMAALYAGNVTQATQPNITSVGTLVSLAVTGNVTANNITASNFIGILTGPATNAATVTNAAQPNITSTGPLLSLSVIGTALLGDINTPGTLFVGANANIGNIGTNGVLEALGNVTAGNLVTAGLLQVSGNANVGNIKTSAGEFTGAITGGTTITAVGNINAGNITTAGIATAANVIAGNGSFSGNITVSGTVNSGNVSAHTAVFSNAVTAPVVTAATTLKTGTYASTAARDLAIPVPTSGMIIFLSGTGKFQGHTGSAWVDLN